MQKRLAGPIAFSISYTMKIESKLGKLAVVGPKHSFEVQIKLTWFEEIFEEYW